MNNPVQNVGPTILYRPEIGKDHLVEYVRVSILDLQLRRKDCH